MNLKDLILGANDIERRAVEVPEWGVTVYVKQLSAQERIAHSLASFDSEGAFIRQGSRGRFLVYCLCDETGAGVFAPDDAAALEAKNATVIERLYDVATEVNGLGKKIDDAEKN